MMNQQVVGTFGNLLQLEVTVIIAFDTISVIPADPGKKSCCLFPGLVILAVSSPSTAAAPGSLPGLLDAFT